MKKCTNCGGVLYFDPDTQNLHCKKCGSYMELEKNKKYEKHPFEMEQRTIEKSISAIDIYTHCPNCGAGFDSPTFEMAGICSYCGSSRTMKLDKEASPDVVLPFAFGIDKAKEKFKENLLKKRFLPNKLRRQTFKDIESIYIPAYLCDIKTHNEYAGELYDEYRDSDGDNHRSYWRIKGTKDVEEKNLLCECSSQITQVTLNQILPFDTTSAVKFSPSYLMGYSVEYYDKLLEDCKKTFMAMAVANVRKIILKGYNYDGVNYLHIHSDYYDCMYSKIILPTYKVKYKFGKKNYVTFMNGQTGAIGGKLPRSKAKIFAFVMGILFGVGIIGMLLAMLIAS